MTPFAEMPSLEVYDLPSLLSSIHAVAPETEFPHFNCTDSLSYTPGDPWRYTRLPGRGWVLSTGFRLVSDRR